MRSKAKSLLWTGSLVTIVAIASSALTTYAEARLSPRGTFRVVVSHGAGRAGDANGAINLPFLATFTGGGGVMTSAIPLSCLAPDEVMSPLHGTWDLTMRRGRPSLRVHLLADVYKVGGPQGASTFEGSVDISAVAPLSGDEVKGPMNINWIPPGPCRDLFGGESTFTAVPVGLESQAPATPPTDTGGK